MDNNKPEITYTEGSDGILYPDMQFTTVPPETQLGKYGSLRRKYLKEHRRGIYSEMNLTGKLMEHLLETDKRAMEMMERLEEEYKKQNPPPQTEEFLKIVQYNNQVRDYAEEIVLRDIVYA